MAISCIDILESQQGADENLSGGLVHIHTLPSEVTVTSIITVHKEALQFVHDVWDHCSERIAALVETISFSHHKDACGIAAPACQSDNGRALGF